MQRPPTAVTYLCKVKVSIPVRYVVHSLTAVCGRGREYILMGNWTRWESGRAETADLDATVRDTILHFIHEHLASRTPPDTTTFTAAPPPCWHHTPVPFSLSQPTDCAIPTTPSIPPLFRFRLLYFFSVSYRPRCASSSSYSGSTSEIVG